jgi:Icc-related predicted phosphoesterase
MTILIVSDLHYNLKQYDWVLSVAEDYDMVIIAGDLLDVAGHADLDTQIIVIVKYLNRLREKVPVIVCSGNHDGDAKNEAGEYICKWLQKARNENLHVDGETLEFEDGSVCVCPWWDGPVTREEMVGFIEGEKGKLQGRWIWVHHAPPTESPVSWTGSKDAGDSFFLECLRKYHPALAFSGHIHNSPFAVGGRWVDRIESTWVFNPGREIGPTPAHIVLDIGEMKARWFSSSGVQEVELKGDSCEPTAVLA